MELHFKANLKNVANPQNSVEQTVNASFDEYPCLSIFLSIIQSEYEQERVRTDRIDNKAMALLTIIIALITVYVPIFPFDKLVDFYSAPRDCPTLLIIISVFLLFAVMAVILAIHSAKQLIDIYKPKEYQAVNIELLNDNEKLSQNPATKFQLELIDHYQTIILGNSKMNSGKTDILNKQFLKTIIIFGLLSVSAAGTLICIGYM